MSQQGFYMYPSAVFMMGKIITQAEQSHTAAPIMSDKKPEQASFQAEGPPPNDPWQVTPLFVSQLTPCVGYKYGNAANLPRWLYEKTLRLCDVRKNAQTK